MQTKTYKQLVFQEVSFTLRYGALPPERRSGWKFGDLLYSQRPDRAYALLYAASGQRLAMVDSEWTAQMMIAECFRLEQKCAQWSHDFEFYAAFMPIVAEKYRHFDPPYDTPERHGFTRYLRPFGSCLRHACGFAYRHAGGDDVNDSVIFNPVSGTRFAIAHGGFYAAYAITHIFAVHNTLAEALDRLPAALYERIA